MASDPTQRPVRPRNSQAARSKHQACFHPLGPSPAAIVLIPPARRAVRRPTSDLWSARRALQDVLCVAAGVVASPAAAIRPCAFACVSRVAYLWSVERARRSTPIRHRVPPALSRSRLHHSSGQGLVRLSALSILITLSVQARPRPRDHSPIARADSPGMPLVGLGALAHHLALCVGIFIAGLLVPDTGLGLRAFHHLELEYHRARAVVASLGGPAPITLGPVVATPVVYAVTASPVSTSIIVSTPVPIQTWVLSAVRLADLAASSTTSVPSPAPLARPGRLSSRVRSPASSSRRRRVPRSR